MTEQHFQCTACGKCCSGWVPLTLRDALANADRFPLAMVWSPIQPTSRAFALTKHMGALVQLPNRKKVAVLLAPTCYIPPIFSCPALSADNLCSIHAEKPLRCRTMPFFPYHEEEDQAQSLTPRKGWLCDTSDAAPLVYKDRKIIDRIAFDAERAELLADAPRLRSSAELLLARNPNLMPLLAKAASVGAGGRFVADFQSFLRLHKDYDLLDFAKKQYPLLRAFEARTKDNPALAEYHAYYARAATELAWFAKRAETQA